MEIISNDKIIKKEISFFEEKCVNAFSNLEIISILDDALIDKNKIHIKHFKKKYPFYRNVIKLLKSEYDEKELKFKISQIIVEYLSSILENGSTIVKHRGVSVLSKRKYGKEKDSIIIDLESMLIEAKLHNEIKKNISTENLVFENKKNKNRDNEQVLKPEIKKHTNHQIENSLNDLKRALTHCKLFDSERKCFHYRDYDKLSSLQSFQFLLAFFILEILKKDIDDKQVIKTEIFLAFNNSFTIVKNDKPQEMTTQNWNKFRKSKLKKLSECDFYNDLSDELKKYGLPQTYLDNQT